jgi:hypothetical protein
MPHLTAGSNMNPAWKGALRCSSVAPFVVKCEIVGTKEEQIASHFGSPC